MYQWSRYNFFINETENSNLLYNSRTGAVVRLSKERSIQVANDTELDDDFFSILYQMDFILDDGVDEVRLIEEFNENARNDRSALSITIELTEACNFRCSYCYQAHKKENIQADIEHGIINLIAERAADLKVVQLNWFGGEPLLRLKDIRRISAAVRPFLKENGIKYRQHMTTNGYLLTPEVAASLYKDGLDNVQITLDGGRKSHDKTRILASGASTYDKVITACKTAVDTGMELMVRINLTKENYQHVEELLSSLRTIGVTPADAIIHIVRAIDHGNLDTDTSSACFSNNEFGQIWPEILKVVARYGFSVPSISPISHNCPFDLDNAVMIGRDGSIRQCSSTAGVIGMLDQKTGQIIKGENYGKYKHRRPTADPHCRECKCLPLCMGGCAYLEGKELQKCNPERYAIEEIVKLYAQQNLPIQEQSLESV